MSAPEPNETVEPLEPIPPHRRSRFGGFFWRDPNTQFLLLAALAGVLGALGAVVFRFLTVRVTHLLTEATDIVSAAESLPPRCGSSCRPSAVSSAGSFSSG